MEAEIVTVEADNETELNSIDVCGDLEIKEQADLRELIDQFAPIFSNKPGCTDTVTHSIRLNTLEPIRAKLYPVPVHMKPHMEKQVDTLLEQKLIRPSCSPYCSQPILVRKPNEKNGGNDESEIDQYRMAVDYRGVNSVSEFDAEPAPRLEEELHKFASAQFFFTTGPLPSLLSS